MRGGLAPAGASAAARGDQPRWPPNWFLITNVTRAVCPSTPAPRMGGSTPKTSCVLSHDRPDSVRVQHIAPLHPKMIAWLQGAGQQWLTTDQSPKPGSDLALDDAPGPNASQVAGFGITTALDHFGSVVDAIMSGMPMRHYAHFTALRTGLLASLRVRWILEPDDSATRRPRCLQVRHQNLGEQRNYLGFDWNVYDCSRLGTVHRRSLTRNSVVERCSRLRFSVRRGRG
jgi:hypothetical protein